MAERFRRFSAKMGLTGPVQVTKACLPSSAPGACAHPPQRRRHRGVHVPQRSHRTASVGEIMYIDFSTIALDQIVNQAAKMRYMFGGEATLPLVIRTMVGAGTRSSGQHSQSLEAWFCHIPGLKVVMPSCPADAKGLLRAAIHEDNPVIFIEHKRLYNTKGPVPRGEYFILGGRSRRHARDSPRA